MDAYHGVIIFAIMHILKTLPDVFEGLEYVSKDGEEWNKGSDLVIPAGKDLNMNPSKTFQFLGDFLL